MTTSGVISVPLPEVAAAAGPDSDRAGCSADAYTLHDAGGCDRFRRVRAARGRAA